MNEDTNKRELIFLPSVDDVAIKQKLYQRIEDGSIFDGYEEGNIPHFFTTHNSYEERLMILRSLQKYANRSWSRDRIYKVRTLQDIENWQQLINFLMTTSSFELIQEAISAFMFTATSGVIVNALKIVIEIALNKPLYRDSIMKPLLSRLLRFELESPRYYSDDVNDVYYDNYRIWHTEGLFVLFPEIKQFIEITLKPFQDEQSIAEGVIKYDTKCVMNAERAIRLILHERDIDVSQLPLLMEVAQKHRQLINVMRTQANQRLECPEGSIMEPITADFLSSIKIQAVFDEAIKLMKRAQKTVLATQQERKNWLAELKDRYQKK